MHNKEKVKAVILVLSSHNNSVYRNARMTWKAYGNTDPEIKTYMVYGHTPNGLPDKDSYDLVYQDIAENYNPGMLRKTVKAIEEIHEKYSYQHFIRTNISTFWDLKALKEHLLDLPKFKCYSGDGPLTPDGYSKDGYYLSGTDTIVTPDMIAEFIKNKGLLNYSIPEDAAMGRIFNGVLGAPFLPNRIHFMEHFTNPRWMPWVSKKTIVAIEQSVEAAMLARKDHFRVKTLQGNRRKIDAAIYKILLRRVYDIRNVF